MTHSALLRGFFSLLFMLPVLAFKAVEFTIIKHSSWLINKERKIFRTIFSSTRLKENDYGEGYKIRYFQVCSVQGYL